MLIPRLQLQHLFKSSNCFRDVTKILVCNSQGTVSAGVRRVKCQHLFKLRHCLRVVGLRQKD